MSRGIGGGGAAPVRRRVWSVAMRAMALSLVLVLTGAACDVAGRNPASRSRAWPGAWPGAALAASGPRSCAAPDAAADPPGPDPVAQALNHYVRGRILMARQQNVQAVEELAKAASLAPGVHVVRLYLGLAQYETGNLAAAAQSLDEALRLRPEDAATLYYRARLASGQRDGKTAVALLERLLKAAPPKSPYRLLGLYYMARAQQEAGRGPEAIAHYEALLDGLAEPQPYFQRYPELFLLFRSQLQLKDTLGRLHLLHGNYAQAVDVLTDVLDERPTNTEVLGLLCRAYVQQKDFAKARVTARKIIEVHPDGAAGYQRLTEVYAGEGNPQGVIPELETHRRAQPGNQALAFQLAEVYKAAGRTGDAAALYRDIAAKAGSREEGSIAAALRLAELAIQENRPVDALRAFGEAMNGEPGDSAILVRAARFIDGVPDRAKLYEETRPLVAGEAKAFGPFVLVAMVAETLGRRDDALALYDKALARQPKAGIAYSRKAELLVQAERLDEALATYRAAVRAGLNVPAFHRRLGMILETLGRLDEAVAEYRLARQGSPDDKPTRYLLAGALARTGRLDEAERELRDLVGRFPDEVQAYVQLAGVYLARGEMDAAEKTVGQAQAVDVTAVLPKSLLAEIRYRQKRLEEAERLAREVLAASAGSHDVRLLLAHILTAQRRFPDAVAEVKALVAAEPANLAWRYFLAGIYSEMGDPAAAELELQGILRQKPDHAPTNNDLGYLWADRGTNLAEAERMIRTALQAEPQSPAYLDSLGWVMYKTGRFEEAVRALEQATQRAPDLDPVLWDHLGDAYWRLRRQTDALKAWQEAARILEARGLDAKVDDLRRVKQKVQRTQEGQAPDVAPLGQGHPAAAPSPALQAK